MRPSTLLRLALTGSRTDTLRVILTAISAALGVLALLAAATVAAIPELGSPDDGSAASNTQYTNLLLQEPGLRPGVVFSLLLLAIPVLALAGQCIRFGSPVRDRRLSALRLAGATPGQAVLVAAAETAVAGGLGSLLGLGAYLAGRAVLDRPDAAGRLPLPTDVLPSAPLVVGAVLLVPVVAALVGAFLLRKVIITPLGVVRRTRRRNPSLWPGVLIIGGVFLPLVIRPLGHWLAGFSNGWGSGTVLVIAGALVVLAVLGVVVGTGWITYTTGRLLHRFAWRPGMLVAGRQLLADPWSGSRTLAALLAGVIVGAGTLAFRATLVTGFRAEDAYRHLTGPESDLVGDGNGFYLRSAELANTAVAVAIGIAVAGVMVALTEGIVSRRRGYAALVAARVPPRTPGEAVAWQTLGPLLPAVAVALTVGVSLVRTIGTTATSSESDVSHCTGTVTQCADPAFTGWVSEPSLPAVTLQVPVPMGDLLILFGGTFAAMLMVVGVGLLFLRMSTDLEELRVG